MTIFSTTLYSELGRTRSGPHTQVGATPPDWMELAWCASSPWSAPEYDKDNATRDEAADMCAGCPVMAQCLAAALEEEGEVSARHRYGVRGGLNRHDRAAKNDRTCKKNPEHGVMVEYRNGERACRACKKASRDERYWKNRTAGCKREHGWENIKVSVDGRRYCVVCRTVGQAESVRARKGTAA